MKTLKYLAFSMSLTLLAACGNSSQSPSNDAAQALLQPSPEMKLQSDLFSIEKMSGSSVLDVAKAVFQFAIRNNLTEKQAIQFLDKNLNIQCEKVCKITEKDISSNGFDPNITSTSNSTH